VKALNATFTKGNMEFANFAVCDCKDVNFQGTQLEKADFSKAQLHRTLFFSANLMRGNFSNAHVIGTNFKSARLRYSDFFNSRCESAIFTKAELMEASFVQAKLKEINFTNLDMRDVDFSGADLTLATLSYAKLDKAKFNETIVVMINFSFTSMKKARISNDQLFKALSIRGMILPNEIVIDRDPNMLYNGHANCNRTSLNSNWQISPPDAIVILPKFDFPEDCLFIKQINDSSFMSQRANLTRYLPLTSRNRAILVLRVRSGGNISFIRIDDHYDRLITVGKFSQGKMKIISITNHQSDVLLGSDLLTLRAQSGTYQPKVTVQFFGYGWCDDIELTAKMSPRIS
jgi:uncharacterized protein YjbI with pentapeptide repeats